MVSMPKESGKLIASLSKNVFIEEDGVKKVAELVHLHILENMKADGAPCQSYYNQEFHPSADHPKAVDWIFVIDMLNFCFWPSQGRWTINGRGGYFTLCSAIKRAIDEGKPVYDPEYYSQVTYPQLRDILRGDDPEVVAPLFDERLKILRENGKILLKKYKGTFVECVKSCNGSAQQLLKLIVDEFESFRDEAEYRDHQVGIYKRAQILVADIWECFKGQGIGHFDDIDSITMFADYRVPQVLLHFGALRYSEPLMTMLQKGVELENGSEEEVEIRGCTIECVESITKEARRLIHEVSGVKVEDREVNAILVDYILWDYRWQHAEELEKTPFHKTRCIYY